MADSPAAHPSSFEQHLAASADARWRLTLFVAGASDRSVRAIGSVRGMCETFLPGRYDLEVVDVHGHADLVTASRVLAAPTLVKEFPLPRQVLVGDMSDTARVLSALGMAPADHAVPLREDGRDIRR